jgi:hypothetical protein
MSDDVMQELKDELHRFEIARDLPCGPERNSRMEACRKRIDQLSALATKKCPDPDEDEILKNKEI